MSDEVALQTAEGWDSGVTTDIALENVVELVTKSSPEDIQLYYEQADENTVSPLEFAFHLLQRVHGSTVVDLGCGSGLNTVILAKLGAQVISIDRSNSNLETTERRAHAHGVAERVTLLQARGFRLPVGDNVADRVFCHAILQNPDPIVTARQIRRILKPGGRAVFYEVGGAGLVRRMCGTAITRDHARTLSKAVGIPDRLREFWLVTSLLHHLGVSYSSSLGRVSQRFDAAVFKGFPFMRSLASTLVWGASKES